MAQTGASKGVRSMKEKQGPPGRSSRFWSFIGLVALGVLAMLMGAFLAVGGAWLAALGGSWYFVLAGVALLVSGLLIAKRRTSGAWLFALTLVASAVWAV